jgi:hypothetical protein
MPGALSGEARWPLAGIAVAAPTEEDRGGVVTRDALDVDVPDGIAGVWRYDNVWTSLPILRMEVFQGCGEGCGVTPSPPLVACFVNRDGTGPGYFVAGASGFASFHS